MLERLRPAGGNSAMPESEFAEIEGEGDLGEV
jgi:hypothetical protein